MSSQFFNLDSHHAARDSFMIQEDYQYQDRQEKFETAVSEKEIVVETQVLN